MAAFMLCNSLIRNQNRVNSETRKQGWWLWNVNPVSLLLWPLSLLFCLIVFIRRSLYNRKILESHKLPIPVIVVGNISLGGNGKTPVVHSVLKLLRQQGYQVGVLTRGYKSDHEGETLILQSAQISQRAGDEANMLSELCACPIAVGAERIKSAQALLKAYPTLDVLIADDGLQHYRLQRDIEIIVERKQSYGNGFCIPAGPMREAKSRLKSADLLIQRDGPDLSESLGECWNLSDPSKRCALSTFLHTEVAALAGIGFPELFFEALNKQITLQQTYTFSDHHEYTERELKRCLGLPLLITHKDAVKIRTLLDQDALQNIWVVPLELTLSDDLQYRLINLLESKSHG